MKLPKFKIVSIEMPWGVDGPIELIGNKDDDYERLTPPKWMKEVMAYCYQEGYNSFKRKIKDLLEIR